MNRFSQIFTSANYGKCCVIGMIHVRALPGKALNEVHAILPSFS